MNEHILISTIGGSKSYGIDTKDSDTDIRGVWTTEDREEILGLKKIRDKISNNDVDSVFWELVHFLKMLKKGNTQSLEILYSENPNILSVDSDFSELILKNRGKFLDTETIVESLKGYIHGEKSRCFVYHGVHGDKRKKAIDKYGYSYKNAVQVLRLAQCGIWFLEDGYFSVNVMERDMDFAQDLLEIKTNPQNFSTREIFDKIEEKIEEFLEVAKNRKTHLDKKFNLDYCLDVIEFFRYKGLKKNED